MVILLRNGDQNSFLAALSSSCILQSLISIFLKYLLSFSNSLHLFTPLLGFSVLLLPNGTFFLYRMNTMMATKQEVLPVLGQMPIQFSHRVIMSCIEEIKLRGKQQEHQQDMLIANAWKNGALCSGMNE